MLPLAPLYMLRPDHPAMTLLLGALVAIAPLAMDIYLPSMPAMTRSLAATPEQVQLTISVYMLGWGAAQLFAGPLSDRFGRKPALIGGLVVFIARFDRLRAVDADRRIGRCAVRAGGRDGDGRRRPARDRPRPVRRRPRGAHAVDDDAGAVGGAGRGAAARCRAALRFGWQAELRARRGLRGRCACAAVVFALPETLRRSDPAALRCRAWSATGCWRCARAGWSGSC